MTTSSANDFLLVGRITGPFGVRGELKVTLISSRPDHLATIKQMFIGATFRPCSVSRLHEHKASVYILRLNEVSTRDEAEELRGTELYIQAKDAAPLDEDEYFLHDLVGLRVQTKAGDDIGTVVELIETGANEVLVVRQIGQADVLIPMVRTIVERIDIAAGIIEVTSLNDIIPQ